MPTLIRDPYAPPDAKVADFVKVVVRSWPHALVSWVILPALYLLFFPGRRWFRIEP